MLDFWLWWVNRSPDVFSGPKCRKFEKTQFGLKNPNLFTGKSLIKLRLSLKMTPVFLTIGKNSARNSTPTGRTYGVPICWHNYFIFWPNKGRYCIIMLKWRLEQTMCHNYFYRSPLEIELKWPKMTVIGNPGSRLNRPRTILILRFSLPETVLPKNEVIWSERNGK